MLWETIVHQIFSKISGKIFFYKKQKKSCRTHQDETFILCLFFTYCSENVSVREDRRALWKKHEKWWNFSNFATLTQKKILKKSELFSKPTKIIKNVSQDVIKPYKSVFTLLWLRCLLDFNVLSFLASKKRSFLKKRKKIRKNSKYNKWPRVLKNYISNVVYLPNCSVNRADLNCIEKNLSDHELLYWPPKKTPCLRKTIRIVELPPQKIIFTPSDWVIFEIVKVIT